jgi:hypothetical protein
VQTKINEFTENIDTKGTLYLATIMDVDMAQEDYWGFGLGTKSVKIMAKALTKLAIALCLFSGLGTDK